MTSLKNEKQKQANYKVLAKSGKEYLWKFTELILDEEDYGNGIYIRVDTPSNEDLYINCIYLMHYNFEEVCVKYLVNWYGENLDKLSEVE